MGRTNYTNIQDLNPIALEESYVLQINEAADRLEFILDAVLLENHPQYSAPPPHERFCFKKAMMTFLKLRELTWLEKTLTPAIDANHEIDYGHIDEFYKENGRYFLSGDWGSLSLLCDSFDFKLLS